MNEYIQRAKDWIEQLDRLNDAIDRNDRNCADLARELKTRLETEAKYAKHEDASSDQIAKDYWQTIKQTLPYFNIRTNGNPKQWIHKIEWVRGDFEYFLSQQSTLDG